MAAKDVLTRPEIDAELATLPHWTLGLHTLRTALKCPTSAAALELFATVGGLAEAANHHPDVDWRYDHLFVALTSHDAGSRVTARDVALARAISDAAESAGAVSRPELLRTVEIAIDSDDAAAIAGTWRQALGYRTADDGSLVDPFGRGPSVWFQETTTPNVNRFHLDVTVPYSRSAEILAAVEGEGASLDHGPAPQFVIATDPQGNRLCVCTEQGRGA